MTTTKEKPRTKPNMTVEENQKLIDNLTEGDVIEFYTCTNADRKLLRGTVKYKEQLGWITNVEGEQYEIRKLVDMNVCLRDTAMSSRGIRRN